MIWPMPCGPYTVDAPCRLPPQMLASNSPGQLAAAAVPLRESCPHFVLGSAHHASPPLMYRQWCLPHRALKHPKGASAHPPSPPHQRMLAVLSPTNSAFRLNCSGREREWPFSLFWLLSYCDFFCSQTVFNDYYPSTGCLVISHTFCCCYLYK